MTAELIAQGGDHGHMEMFPPFHRIKSGENLLVKVVAGSSQEDEGA